MFTINESGLFAWISPTVLSRTDFSNHTNQVVFIHDACLGPNVYSGHSYRATPVPTAAIAGLQKKVQFKNLVVYRR